MSLDLPDREGTKSAGDRHPRRRLAIGGLVACALLVAALMVASADDTPTEDPPGSPPGELGSSMISPPADCRPDPGPSLDNLDVANGFICRDDEDVYHAGYDGEGDNGYARGVISVEWHEGETVRYAARFFLPEGFGAALRGTVAIMRWDNWVDHGSQGDFGGVVLMGSGSRVHLVHGGYDRGFEGDLVPGVRVPEGRWVRIEVLQRLSSSGDATSVVQVDGEEVGRSTAPNMAGRDIKRIRYGLVAISAGEQVSPLGLRFADAEAERVAR